MYNAFIHNTIPPFKILIKVKIFYNYLYYYNNIFLNNKWNYN